MTELTVRGADGQLGARLYVPRDAGRGLLVFFHGGGWVVGDLDTHDALCRALAADAGIRVLAVDYRLAPEAPAPTAAEDAIAAFTWAVEHAEDLGADPSLVAVGGDSAGGNLAAVVAQQCVRRNLPQPALQVLLYPASTSSAAAPAETSSPRASSSPRTTSSGTATTTPPTPRSAPTPWSPPSWPKTSPAWPPPTSPPPASTPSETKATSTPQPSKPPATTSPTSPTPP